MPYENLPMIVNETVGTKHYCACGESKNKPYCDGAHEKMKTGKAPKEHVIAVAKRYAICDCGITNISPFCDGSHDKCAKKI